MTVFSKAACVLLVIGVVAHAQQSIRDGRLISEQTIDTGDEVELKGLSLAPDGSKTWLLLSSRPKRSAQPPTVFVTSIDKLGKAGPKIRVIPRLNNRDKQDELTPTGLVVDQSSRAIVVFEGSYVGIMSLARAGAELPIDVKRLPGTDVHLRGIIADRQGNAILFGSKEAAGYVATIDVNGRLVSEWLGGPMPLEIIDGVAEQNGSLAVVGVTEGVGGATRLWIARLSGREVSESVTANGHTGALAVLSTGLHGLVSEILSSGRQDVALTALDAKFLSRWSKVVSSGSPAPVCGVAALHEDGFVVGGTMKMGLAVWKFTDAGDIAWSYLRDPLTRQDLEVVSNCRIVTVENDVVLGYGAFVRKQNELHRVVRVIRLDSR
jgi:hypothetical protein